MSEFSSSHSFTRSSSSSFEKLQVLGVFMAGFVYTIYTLTDRAVGNL